MDGYARLFAARSFPVDEFLPSAGVAVNDLFWIVMQGPAIVLTGIACDAGNVITEGDRVVAATGATSQATTAGRVRTHDQDTAANSTGSALANQIFNAIGAALSAKTTANTNADLLVDVKAL